MPVVGRDDHHAPYPGWGLDGKALHAAVAPERWCITRRDLVFLRREIWQAVCKGEVRPVAIDPATQFGDEFDPKDKLIGPNMYNVVDVFIKPLTLEAGKMSWALLRHPAGMKCDIFITHCWAEGAFEFIDKVLASWPLCQSAAWCCILANPQNLDIQHLIQTPGASPFAKALRCASHVMAVPTRKVSIYSRVWCAYEAYLGVQEEKIIFTAYRPIWREMLQSTVIGASLACIAVIVGYFSERQAQTSTQHGLWGQLYWILNLVGSTPLTVIALVLVRRPRISAGINILGVVFAAWSLGGTIVSSLEVAGDVVPKAALTHLGLTDWPYLFLHACSILFFVANEVDRLRFVSSRSEAELLQNDLHEIRRCAYTVRADYDSIMADIGDHEEAVNKSIAVLIDAGMSTPALRRAAGYGVDLRGAANLRLAVGWLGSSYWCATTYMMGTQWPVSFVVPEEVIIIDWALKCLCFLTWLCKGWDEKAFVLSAVTKIVMPNVAVFLVYQMVSSLDNSQEPLDYPIICSSLALLVNALALTCALLGRHRMAAIPLIGPTAAHVLGPGCKVCGSAMATRPVIDSASKEEAVFGKRGCEEVCGEQI